MHMRTTYSLLVSLLWSNSYLQVEPFCLLYTIKYSSFFQYFLLEVLRTLSTLILHSRVKKKKRVLPIPNLILLSLKWVSPRVYIAVDLNEELSEVLHPAIFFLNRFDDYS